MEDNWSSFLSYWQNTGLHFLPIHDGEDTEIQKAAAENNLKVTTINMQRVIRKQTFLRKMAKGLEFPAHFGYNWDALFDCLTDLSLSGADGHVILIYNLQLLESKAPADFKIIRKVFETAADYWHSHQMRFFIIISEKSSLSNKVPNDR
ncbi:MAG: barstar family protein [Dehalococcoidales bacterium]|jgi:RNAse (barnase) inhibitor barstar|nr:barstar family protein [Dehalococcoidales bacterium]MDX9986543.1 barstar family protein [Dehalococcoidales bacterium]